MPETTETNAQPTTDESVINTGAETTGAATQTVQAEATPEKTFTQADVDRIVQNRLKSAVKAELKKLTTDDQTPSIEDLQRQLTEATEKTRISDARESIRDYVADPKNKLNAKNTRAIEKLVLAELEFDENGPTNLKEAIESIKGFAPELFAQTNVNINASNGKLPVTSNDMNDFIRQQHAGR